MRPRLPPAARLLSYLRRIDLARSYTNWGPLVSELELRIAAHLGLPTGSATVASSGTTALIGAVLATAGRATPAAPLAIVPAFTFVATALAAEQCGFQPYLVDVDAESWSAASSDLEHHQQLSRVGVVIPVAPFGRAVPQAPWVEFRRRTGIPVVIDGAASFEAIRGDPLSFVGPIPVVLSFHATKSFSTAEGGCVLTTDADALRRVGESSNFGFSGSRDCVRASTNGKMSEYHAAIGLAELDGWAAKQSALLRVADEYRARLQAVGLENRLVAAPQVASCYALFRCSDRLEADTVVHALTRAGVESRRWYGSGVQHQPYYRGCPRDDVKTTESLAARLLAIPVAPDLSRQSIRRVVEVLASAVGNPR